MAPKKAKGKDKKVKAGASPEDPPAESQESEAQSPRTSPRTKGPVQGVDFHMSRRDGAAPEPPTPGDI